MNPRIAQLETALRQARRDIFTCTDDQEPAAAELIRRLKRSLLHARRDEARKLRDQPHTPKA